MNLQSYYKYKVFLRRISTMSQDPSMQETADAPYRQQYSSKEIIIINEYGVSANKLYIAQRPKIQKLIKLIENNKVEVVYVFDRSRLFRKHYEGVFFIDLCKKHNVKIIFTSTGHQEASNNTLIEGVMSIVNNLEGENITKRNAEARRRFPGKKFGYIKNKEDRTYKKNPEKEDTILEFFNVLRKVETITQLDKLLRHYKKLFKKTPEKLLEMAVDPFYAGYDISDNENKLPHVEPYLSLEDFKNLLTKNVIISTYSHKKVALEREHLFQPYCSKCNKLMKFDFSILENKAWYSCSKKSNHSKILLPSRDLFSVVSATLSKAIEGLDTDKLLRDSRTYINQIRMLVQKDLEAISKRKEQIRQAIILENDDLVGWKLNPSYNELLKLEDYEQQLLKNITEKEELLLENKELSNLTKNYLTNSKEKNFALLVSMLIKRLDIYPEKIVITLNKFDYLSHLEPNYTFEGSDLQ
ncbi:recombinase family protein [Bacillus sp. 1780r2a1]|nr:recombinase family protein [Bacillus sp. 1780r2a1]